MMYVIFPLVVVNVIGTKENLLESNSIVLRLNSVKYFEWY